MMSFVEGDQIGAALDVDGSKMLDDKGRALIKICEDEDDKEGNAMRELEEIQDIAPRAKPLSRPREDSTIPAAPKVNAKQAKGDGDVAHSNEKKPPSIARHSSASIVYLDEQWKRRPDSSSHTKHGQTSLSESSQPILCSMCSFENDHGLLTCATCSNVLNPKLMPDHWRCRSSTCKDSQYINAGDAGICGVCGVARGS